MFPIAFVFMMSVMGGYAKDYEGAVQATNEMSSSMIEYINGIEVIKAFNQGKTSYARLAEKVRANAQYYFDWMRRSQLGMSMAYAFFPAQMAHGSAVRMAVLHARHAEHRNLPHSHH